MRQFATFRIDDRLFGINVLQVREINRVLDITPVPSAPAYVRGLVNLRGQVVTVFDLGVRLGLASREIGHLSHNIILKTSAELSKLGALNSGDEFFRIQDAVGLLVDDIGDVVQATESDIESPPANVADVQGRFFSGVIELADDLLVILNMKEILIED